MNFSQNYFELFGLPVGFSMDKNLLASSYRRLQKELHPDNFVSQSASEQRLAVQFASKVNSAYQTLKSPLLCAEYLMELSGHSVNSDTLTIKKSEFLLKQMEWRETLADLAESIKSSSIDSSGVSKNLELLSEEVSAEYQRLLERFQNNFEQKRYSQAVEDIAEWHFVEKMQASIDELEDKLFD